MSYKKLWSASLGCTLLIGCGAHSEQATPSEDAAAHEESHREAEVHWGYGSGDGPERWAELAPAFSLCGDGRRQSPIDLGNAVPGDAAPITRRLEAPVLTVDQRATLLDLVDNGHTIQVSNVASLSLDMEGEHFELVQYHFHAPSEHTIHGEHSPLEVHFVHKSAAGHLAVVGVLVEQGEHDPVFDPLIAALPSGPGARHIKGLDLDIDELHPLPEQYFRYEGSLTTPPCSEGVQWIVMAARRRMSAEQMAELASHLHHNNRPVQPLDDRELVLVSE